MKPGLGGPGGPHSKFRQMGGKAGGNIEGASKHIVKSSKIKSINMHAIRRSGQAEARKQSKKFHVMDKKMRMRLKK